MPKTQIVEPQKERKQGALTFPKVPLNQYQGKLTKELTVRAHAFSVGAVEQIQAAGGTVEVIE